MGKAYAIYTPFTNGAGMPEGKIILLKPSKTGKTMAGIFVELALSWILLWLFERRHLSALGVFLTRQRLLQFIYGLLLPGISLLAFYWGLSLLVKNPYQLNPRYTGKDFWNAVAYLLRSVAYENLIFTGALLYILIRRIGPSKAILVSAAGFGIYHWFSFGVIGQPVQMLFIFLLTGIGGYLFALAFEKTRSVYLPFALHFGLDFVPMILFSKEKNIGPQLLVSTFKKDPAGMGSFVSVLMSAIYFIVIPLLIFWWLRRLTPEKNAVPAVKNDQ